MTQTLFGGSSGKTQQQSTSQSGFSQLPPEIQQAFTQYGTQATNQFANPQTSLYTPIGQTAGETTALNTINQGFAPTADQIQSSVAEQTNPYDQSVIDTINRNAAGAGSVLDSQLSNAGQYGSNRAALGANDIDLSRLQQIGNFKNGEFQTAMNNALTTIPGLNQASAAAQLQGGAFQRGLGLQTAQAPVSALSAYGTLLGVLPQTGGSTSQSSGSGQTSSSTGVLPTLFG
jgi:hypothetical protein